MKTFLIIIAILYVIACLFIIHQIYKAPIMEEIEENDPEEYR